MDLDPLPAPEHPDPYRVEGRRLRIDNPWIRVRWNALATGEAGG